jgi:cytochrome b561
MPSVNSGLMGHIARATNWGLYILLAATLILGMANAWIRGDRIVGLFTIPSLAPGDTALRNLVEYLHSTAANVILIVAGLHAVAALFHHFVLHDAVLRRMLPTRRSARW